MAEPSTTGIELTAKHNPMAFLLPRELTVDIDGSSRTEKWGTTLLHTSAGKHRLEISFRYMGKQRGKAAVDVTVPEGGTVKVRYRMPSWMFAAGRVDVG